MLKPFRHSSIKIGMLALLFTAFVSGNALKARAFPVSENNGAPKGTTVPEGNAARESARLANILYAPLNDVTFEAEKPATTPEAAFDKAVRTGLPRPAGNLPDTPAPAPQSTRVLHTIPMTVGEKFNYFFKSAFLSPGAYGSAIFSGLYGEAISSNHGRKRTASNYFGDAGTRAVRSFTFGATSKFFERFMLASLFRQDPRYHRSEKKGAGARMLYAASRVFITQGDKGGSQFNISYLGGGAGAAFLSRLYDRDERHKLSKVMSKWTTHIGITALTNIIREFVSGQ